MLWAIRLAHAVGNAGNRQFFTEIEMPIGHKDFPGGSMLLLECSRPHLAMTLTQLRRIAPGASQITAHRGDLAASLVYLEHAGFEKIQVVEEVEIFVKQLFAGQIDVIERTIATVPERRDTLIRSIMDGEIDRHVLEVRISQVKGHQAHVIVVQVHGVEMFLGNIAGHGLPHRGVESERHPRITGVDGAGVGPVQLPVVPEVDRALAIVEDVLIDLEGKSMASQGHLRVDVEPGELTFVVVRKAGGENGNVEVEVLLPGRFDQFSWQLLDNRSQTTNFCTHTATHPAYLPGQYGHTQGLLLIWHVFSSVHGCPDVPCPAQTASHYTLHTLVRGPYLCYIPSRHVDSRTSRHRLLTLRAHIRSYARERHAFLARRIRR